MAYIPEEEKKREQEEGQGIGTPQGGGLIGAGGAGVGGAQVPRRGTEFATLQKYLAAGRPQAAGLAEKMAGTTTAAGEEARGLAQKAQESLGTALQPYESASAAPLIQSTIDPYKARTLSAARPARSIIGIAPAIGPSSSQLEAARTLLAGQYGGPQEFSELEQYGQAQEAARKAEEGRKMLGTEAGRMQLLSEQYQPGRTLRRGLTALDQAIMQASPEARAVFEQTQEQLKGIPGEFEKLGEAGRERIAAAKTRLGEESEKFGGALKQASSDILKKQAEYASPISSPFAYAQEQATAISPHFARLLGGASKREIQNILNIKNPRAAAVKGARSYGNTAINNLEKAIKEFQQQYRGRESLAKQRSSLARQAEAKRQALERLLA
jgi:hypothetical protein